MVEYVPSYEYWRETATLLNQLANRCHCTRTVEIVLHDGERHFTSELAHNRETNTQYLMHDTLYFRVSVHGSQGRAAEMHSKVNS
jgi:hypothetical protein